MRVLDCDQVLTVAHTVDGETPLATLAPVGLIPARRSRAAVRPVTRCGLEVGPTWVNAEPYGVPDCADCVPADPGDEFRLLPAAARPVWDAFIAGLGVAV